MAAKKVTMTTRPPGFVIVVPDPARVVRGNLAARRLGNVANATARRARNRRGS